MSFTTKVKATNELFHVTTDFGIDGKSYREQNIWWSPFPRFNRGNLSVRGIL